MDKQLGSNDVRSNCTKVKVFGGGKKDKNKLSKCNQCDYASDWTSALRRHLKTHSGEKSNKCNQCGYASTQADNLTTHIKRKHIKA